MNMQEETLKILIQQLSSFWSFNTEDENCLAEHIGEAISLTINSFDQSNRIYYLETGFDILNTSVYAVFLYYLAHEIGFGGGQNALADKIYYLNKIMNGVEWYWNIKLPDHFIVEHPIGSVLGRAGYGDYFCIYQGVTVGANFSGSACIWPKIGKYVTMYANSSIIGNCQVGNYVIIGANALIMDQNIPDGCMVFGRSPDLILKKKTEEEIRKRLVRIWNFDRM